MPISVPTAPAHIAAAVRLAMSCSLPTARTAALSLLQRKMAFRTTLSMKLSMPVFVRFASSAKCVQGMNFCIIVSSPW